MPSRRGRYVFALIVIFAVSRLFYWWIGVRFDAWALTNSWQLLPQDLLRNDLVGSLWYLHSQPPLFNAIVGATLHLPHARGLVNIEFVACTLALAIVLFLTMLELAVPMPLAFVSSSLFVVSPSTVLYENWMYYTYPVALLSVAAVWCFAKYVRTRHTGYGVGVVTMLALLALTRASYHLVIVIAGAVLIVLMAKKAGRRRVAAAVTLPVLLVAGLYLKNYVLFGEPNSSSWLGMNLAHMVLGNQPEAVQADVDRGVLSRQALTPAFVDLGAYSYRHAPTGIPALDRPLKEPGVNNYNNLAYIDVSRRYQKDALTFIRRHPDLYARTVGDSFRTMFVPASDFIGVQFEKQNYVKLRRALEIENRLYGQFVDYEQPARSLGTTAAPDRDEIAWGIVLAYAATVFAGAVIAIRSVRRRRWSVVGATFVFLAAVVCYATFSSNMFELGENMRFRLETDPLVIAGVTALLARVVAVGRTRYARADREPEPTLVLATSAASLEHAPANGNSGALHETEPSRR